MCKHKWDHYFEGEYAGCLVVVETCGRCGVDAIVRVIDAGDQWLFAMGSMTVDGKDGDDQAFARAQDLGERVAGSMGLLAPAASVVLPRLRASRRKRRTETPA